MDKLDKAISLLKTNLLENYFAKANLTKEEKDVFIMRELKGKSLVQVSMDLFMSESTVKRRYKSARRKINKII